MKKIVSLLLFIVLSLSIFSGCSLLRRAVLNSADKAEILRFEIQSDYDVSEADVEIVREVMISRLNELGYSEAVVSTEGSGTRIHVFIPGDGNNKYLSDVLTQIGNIEFRDSNGEVVLGKEDIVSAQAKFGEIDDSGTKKWHTLIKLSGKGRKMFKAATKDAASRSSTGENYIGIYLDDELILCPFVDSSYALTGIDSDEVVLTFGDENVDEEREAKNVEALINSAPLPSELDVVCIEYLSIEK